MGTQLNSAAVAAANDLFQRPQSPAPQSGKAQQNTQPNNGYGNSGHSNNGHTNNGHSSRRGWTPDADFVPAKIYLNVGIRVPLFYDDGQPVLDPETGLQKTKDILLPKGLAIDTMEALDTRSSNPDSPWPVEATERNSLLRLFQSLGQKLQPGTDEMLPDTVPLVGQLRHRRDENEAQPAVASAALNGMAAMFGLKT